jgi:hypothetical protein
MSNTEKHVELTDLLSVKPGTKANGNKPAKKWLVQVTPEQAQEIRVMLNIPTGTTDVGCTYYILNFAKAGRDAGYTVPE